MEEQENYGQKKEKKKTTLGLYPYCRSKIFYALIQGLGLARVRFV